MTELEFQRSVYADIRRMVAVGEAEVETSDCWICHGETLIDDPERGIHRCPYCGGNGYILTEVRA